MEVSTDLVCERCGKLKTVSYKLKLHKCPFCENVRFERELLQPIERQFISNLKNLKETVFGSIQKESYLFGSYVAGREKCGDIDVLITYDESQLNSLIDIEIKNLLRLHEMMVEGDVQLSVPISIFKDGFFDFRTCQEYPNCLECHGSRRCKLPLKDYQSEYHTFCEEQCKKGDPYSSCLFEDCPDLKREIRDKIHAEIRTILTRGGIEFLKSNSGRKIKILDPVMKKSVEELKDEFKESGVEKEFHIKPIETK